jgi:arsenical pump membrane protein
VTGARIAWTQPAPAGDRLLLVIDLRTIAAVSIAAGLLAAPMIAAPLGRLSSPFALLLVLPPLALALESFGWRERLAGRFTPIGRPLRRLLATYVAWLGLSALLTLDVAAVAAASVGIAVAGDRDGERRWQLGGAILGANVGSLLLPFSNLTNLVLLSATSIGFGAYVGLAVAPQVAAAVAVGALFAIRARRSIVDARDSAAPAPRAAASDAVAADAGALARASGAIAVAGSVAAICVGLTGGDMAVPFAASAALLVGVAIASGRLTVQALARTIPVAGLGVIVGAALVSGPIASAAALLPMPANAPAGLLLALLVGSLLAALVNNLPAAAFGAAWLARAHPATIVAYLIGTNVAALATPHGSVATILARAVGGRHGVPTATGAYLRSAWRYALVGAVAGLVALSLVAR